MISFQQIMRIKCLTPCVLRIEKLECLMGMDSPWPWYGQLMRRPQVIAYFLQTDFWLRHYGVDLIFD